MKRKEGASLKELNFLNVTFY